MEVRSSSLVDLGDLSAPVGSYPWVKAVHVKARTVLNDAVSAREHVELWVNGLLQDNHFQQLCDERGHHFMTWEDFCQTRQPFGLGYSPAAIAAIKESRPALRERMQEAVDVTTGEILPEGRPSKLGKLPSLLGQVNRASASGIGERTQRKIDHLARSFPALHAAVKAGSLSVHAAAIQAGIVQPTMTIPCDPLKAARAIKARYTSEQFAIFSAALEGGL